MVSPAMSTNNMSQTEGHKPVPRAMIHKRILDTASDRPEASLGSIADDIPGASPALVEQVLNEYGDPAGEDPGPPVPNEGPSEEVDETQTPATEDGSEPSSATNIDELSASQREMLQAVNESPSATQRELGEILGVSAATICNRLSDIAGFAWEDRRDFVADHFEQPVLADGQGQTQVEVLPELEDRLEEVERQLDSLDARSESPVLELELAHKVVHACMNSDQFAEDEELAIIRAVFGSSTPNHQS